MENTTDLSRREILAAMLATGAVSFIAGAQTAPSVTANARDWDWLLGDWDVKHSRLKDRLVNSQEWQEFTGKSSFWTTMGGLGNVDDNLLELPAGLYRGLSLRAFDPKTSSWAIWWVDGRNPEHIDPPVRGGFKGDEGEFIGTDVYKGTPVTVRFRWHEVRSKRPWWDQAFSTDGGKTWEINWRNYFTRTRATATGQPRIAGDPPEARHGTFSPASGRCATAGCARASKSNGTSSTARCTTGRCWAGAATSVTTGSPRRRNPSRHEPARLQRREEGMAELVADGRSPANIGAPLRGKFVDGIGTLIGDDDMRRQADEGALAVDPHRHRLAALGAGRVAAMTARPGKRTGWRTSRAPADYFRGVSGSANTT